MKHFTLSEMVILDRRKGIESFTRLIKDIAYMQTGVGQNRFLEKAEIALQLELAKFLGVIKDET